MASDRAAPEPGELVRALFAAVDGGADYSEVLGFFTPDAVFDSSPMGMETASGRDAVRAMWEAWSGVFEDWHIRPDEVRELGNGIVLVASYQRGRPLGGAGEVEMRQGWVIEFADGKVSGITLFPTLEEARAAAERLV
jgi:ketosteroid isomerase-like protein